MPTSVKKESETELVKSVLSYLAWNKIFAWRNNSGMAWQSNPGGKSFPIRMGQKGSPDIIGIMPNGKFFGIECKVGNNKPSPDQQDFLQKIIDNNGLALVAYNLDEVMLWLKLSR